MGVLSSIIYSVICAGYVMWRIVELVDQVELRRARRRAVRRIVVPAPAPRRCPYCDYGTCKGHAPEHQDAIPRGYPGYKGSIRYIPYTNDETDD